LESGGIASCPGHFTPQYPQDRKLGGPQHQSEHGGEEKQILSIPLPGIKLQSSSPQPNYYNE